MAYFKWMLLLCSPPSSCLSITMSPPVCFLQVQQRPTDDGLRERQESDGAFFLRGFPIRQAPTPKDVNRLLALRHQTVPPRRLHPAHASNSFSQISQAMSACDNQDWHVVIHPPDLRATAQAWRGEPPARSVGERSPHRRAHHHQERYECRIQRPVSLIWALTRKTGRADSVLSHHFMGAELVCQQIQNSRRNLAPNSRKHMSFITDAIVSSKFKNEAAPGCN